MESIASYIEGGAIYNLVNATSWLWPVMEIIHFCGLSIMLGALIITDLRLCGFFRSVSIQGTHAFIPWIFFGFGLNLVTGVLFIFGDPVHYEPNMAFRIKILLIGFAGLNAAWFLWKLQPLVNNLQGDAEPPTIVKVVASVSLATWLAVLLLGRLIPYVSTG